MPLLLAPAVSMSVLSTLKKTADTQFSTNPPAERVLRQLAAATAAAGACVEQSPRARKTWAER